MKNSRWLLGLSPCLLGSALLLPARGASSLSNPLTGFSGDTTQAGTQGALLGAGLEAASLTPGAAVSFDANGARFGPNTPGDAGRNYLRTVASDYATVSFVAEINMTFASEDQQAFVGFGAGGVALFGTPDWSTQFSSTSFWPELANDKLTNFRTQNDVNSFSDTAVPGLGIGTHRFRMSFDLPTQSLTGSIDLDYAGGPFTADATSVPLILTSLFAPDGWPTEPSRIFFGGDDGILFTDLVVTVDDGGDHGIPEGTAPAWLLALGTLVMMARHRLGRVQRRQA